MPPGRRPRAARGADRSPAGRGHPPGRPAADRGRGRLGQDPGPDPADRPPHRHGRRRALADPGHHLHQQGGRRDAPAGGRPGRPAGPAHVGVHLPLGLCPHPPGPRRPPRATRDRSPSTTTPIPGAWSRSSAASSTSTRRSCRPAHPRPDQPGQVEPAGAGRVPGGRGDHLRPADRRRLRRVPAADGGGQRHGLRRPAAQRGPAVPGAPRRPGALPPALHPYPHRRVPGHQRRPERAGRAAGRRAPQHRGGGGQRPVRLPVPGGGHHQHLGVRSRRSPMPPR